MDQKHEADQAPIKFSHARVRVGERENWVRVVPDGREGHTLFVRKLLPTEQDTGEVVIFAPGQETIVLTEHIRAIGITATPEVGRTDDLLTWVRAVPAGREGSTVYIRSLQPGESDTGESVQVRPGDRIVIRARDLVLTLDGIDWCASGSLDNGYAPITDVLWTWLTIVGSPFPDSVRFVLSTGRRLDASYHLFQTVAESLQSLDDAQAGALKRRRVMFEVMGLTEIAVVALTRALRMVCDLSRHFGVTKPPAVITEKLPALKEIRDAYEHVDERTRGLVKRVPHPDALSGTDFQPLFEQKKVVYGKSSLDLDRELTTLLSEARSYLKVVAGELVNPTIHDVEIPTKSGAL